MTSCAFNCNKCLLDNGPHVCRHCKGQNIHLSNYCPMVSDGPGGSSIMIKGIERKQRGLPPVVCCFFCKAEDLHRPFDCPRKDVKNIDKRPCVFNCLECEKKPLKGPHVCIYCNAKNLHRSDKCLKIVHETEDCAMVKEKSKSSIIIEGIVKKLDLPPGVCFFCEVEGIHCSFDCPKADDYPDKLARIVKRLFLNTNTRKHLSHLFKLLIDSYEQFEQFINSNECLEVYETKYSLEVDNYLKLAKILTRVFLDINKNREFLSVFNAFINSNEQFTEFNNVVKLRNYKARSVKFSEYSTIRLF